MKLRSILSTLGLVLSVLVASTANAAVISVNFNGGQNGSNGTSTNGAGTVTTTAGAVPSINWNNLAGASSGAVGVISDAGAAAGSVAWSSPNTWAATGSAPAGGGSATMMSGYLDIGNGASNSVSVTGLSPAFTAHGYSVLVYFNGDSGGTQGWTAADNAGNTDTGFGRQVGGGGTNFPLAGPNGFIVSTASTFATATASNAVLLEGFVGANLTITGVPGNDGNRARINGFQIVANTIPEPASLSLLAMGGAALLRRRRTA